jgi:hypothetical protein
VATSRSTWKQFERVVATIFGSFRVPLSGINSRHNAGDVIVPPGMEFLAECKYREKFLHHKLFRDAQADAAKNGVKTFNVFLFTKQKSETGFLVTMTGDMFNTLMQIPGRDWLKKA